MASNYVDTSEEISEEQHHNRYEHHHHHQQHQAPSPRSMRRSWSSNSNCGHHEAVPKCVCAPATHANSFKCRLHRAPSHGPSSAPSASLPPQPAVSSSSTRTVAAQ